MSIAERLAEGGRLARRVRWFVLALHIPYVCSAPFYSVVRAAAPGLGATAPVWVAVLLGIGPAVLQLRHSTAAMRGERPAGWPWTLTALAVLVYVPIWWLGMNWMIAEMIFIASALMLLPARAAIVVTLAAGVGSGVAVAVAVAPDGMDDMIFYGLIYAVSYPLFGAGLYTATRLVQTVEQLQGARTELAATVVDRERIRVSRDLHDLVGQSLSAVSLKGDLAMRLLPIDSGLARAEIAGMADTARATLSEMRAVAGGKVGIDLETEISGAITLLEAAGVTTRLAISPVPLSDAAESVFSWTVREGTTNVLRHSDATWCRIALSEAGRTARLEIVNDGARAGGEPGTGLDGLAERAAAVGGSVATSAGSAEFRLVVAVPTEGGSTR